MYFKVSEMWTWYQPALLFIPISRYKISPIIHILCYFNSIGYIFYKMDVAWIVSPFFIWTLKIQTNVDSERNLRWARISERKKLGNWGLRL